MLTKTDIKECLLQLQQELITFAPHIEGHLAIIQEKDQTIQRRHQQIDVQADSFEKEGYELKVPLYPLYISYLQSLRDLGFVVLQIRDYNRRLQTIIQAIQRLVRRIDRFFPDNATASQVRLEFSKIAIECENTQFGLEEVIGTLAHEMSTLAYRYVKNDTFKAGMDAAISSLAINERDLLWEWCKPWVDAFVEGLSPGTSALDTALATLQPSLEAVIAAPVLCQ